jgi:hypothetical protein
MSFFVKACVQVLKELPEINSEIFEDKIIYKNYFDIGVAIGSEKGLVVPIIRNADRIIDEDIKNPKRVVFCSGKIFYELDDYRKENKIKNVKIVRLEQIYPFPFDTLGEVIQKHKDAEMLWVQEEPKNMGAWSFVKSRIRHLFKKNGLEQNLYYIGRRRAAAPATGIAKRHNANQNLIKKLALHSPLKSVIKEKIGVSFVKFKNLPTNE